VEVEPVVGVSFDDGSDNFGDGPHDESEDNGVSAGEAVILSSRLLSAASNWFRSRRAGVGVSITFVRT